jgi:hypothetical protein
MTSYFRGRYRRTPALIWGELLMASLGALLLAIWVPSPAAGRGHSVRQQRSVPTIAAEASKRGLAVRRIKIPLFNEPLAVVGGHSVVSVLVWVACSRRCPPKVVGTRLIGMRAYPGGVDAHPNYVAPMDYHVYIRQVDVHLHDVRAGAATSSGWEWNLKLSATAYIYRTMGWRISGLFDHLGSWAAVSEPVVKTVVIGGHDGSR